MKRTTKLQRFAVTAFEVIEHGLQPKRALGMRAGVVLEKEGVVVEDRLHGMRPITRPPRSVNPKKRRDRCREGVGA